jgi:hypothetical protein
MKECPEEFLESTKWNNLLNEARHCLPVADIEALQEGMKQINVDRFNEAVLKTLAGEPLEVEAKYDPNTMTYKARERYAGGWTDPRAFVEPAMQAEQQRQMMRNANLAGQNSALQGLGVQGGSNFFSGLFK